MMMTDDTMREIRRFDKWKKLLMRKLPFQTQWLLHEIVGDLENYLRFQATAIVAQQEATKAHMLSLSENTNRADIHAKRVATMGKDLALAKRLRGRRILIRFRVVFEFEVLSLAMVLELEVVSNSATDSKVMRVFLRLIQLALGDDNALNAFYKGHFCVKARGQLQRALRSMRVDGVRVAQWFDGDGARERALFAF